MRKKWTWPSKMPEMFRQPQTNTNTCECVYILGFRSCSDHSQSHVDTMNMLDKLLEIKKNSTSIKSWYILWVITLILDYNWYTWIYMEWNIKLRNIFFGTLFDYIFFCFVFVFCISLVIYTYIFAFPNFQHH